MTILRCPSCHAELKESYCTACHRDYIYDFLDDTTYESDDLYHYYEHEYDAHYDIQEQERGAKENYASAASLLNCISYQSVLDLGCGTGSFVAQFSGERYGMDISSPALQAARRLHPDVTFFRADTLRLPVQDKSVDLVTFTDLIEHVEDPRALLQEIRRVGHYLLLKVPLEDTLINNLYKRATKANWKNMMGHIHFWHRKSFQRLMQEEGFVPLTSCHYTKTPLRLKGSWKFKTYNLLRYLSSRLLPRFVHERLFNTCLYALYATTNGKDRDRSTH